MTDTLRSIAEGMEHEAKTQDLHPSWKTFREIHDRLEALLAEYEVDLVKKWRELAYFYSFDQEGKDEAEGNVRRAARVEIWKRCADELETWLAVNLERIKREACDGMLALIPSRDNKRLRTLCLMKNGTYYPLEIIPATLADEIEQRIAALEAQAKEKP